MSEGEGGMYVYSKSEKFCVPTESQMDEKIWTHLYS